MLFIYIYIYIYTRATNMYQHIGMYYIHTEYHMYTYGRSHRKLFHGGGRGGWVKMSATMVGGQQQNLKWHWIKCHKTVPKKRNFTQKTSLILRASIHATLQKIYSLNTSKNMFLVGVTKKERNISTALFLDIQVLHSRSIWKSNVCIFL